MVTSYRAGMSKIRPHTQVLGHAVYTAPSPASPGPTLHVAPIAGLWAQSVVGTGSVPVIQSQGLHEFDTLVLRACEASGSGPFI